MTKVYLQKYVIQVKNKESGEMEPINVFNGNDDLFIVLKRLLKKRILEEHRFESQGYDKALQVSKPIIVDTKQRVLFGYMLSGLKGDQTDFREDTKKEPNAENPIEIVDDEELDALVEDHEEPAPIYSSKNDHTAYQKHLFYFWVPKGGTKAYLFFHKKSKNGVKIRFEHAFNEEFKTQGYSLKYAPIFGSEFSREVFVDFLEKYPLTKISLTKNYKSLKKLDEIIKIDRDEIPDELRPSQRVNITVKGKDLYRYRLEAEKWVRRKDKNLESVTLFDGTEDEEISLTVNVKGHPRTFRVVKGTSMPEEDITKEIKIQVDTGLPDPQSFINAVEKRIEEYGRRNSPRITIDNKE